MGPDRINRPVNPLMLLRRPGLTRIRRHVPEVSQEQPVAETGYENTPAAENAVPYEVVVSQNEPETIEVEYVEVQEEEATVEHTAYNQTRDDHVIAVLNKAYSKYIE